MKRKLIITLAALLTISLQNSFSQNINGDVSQVNFSVSNMKWRTVEGTFKGMTGNIVFDKNDLEHSMMDVCISAASVNTDNKKRDEHLRNEDFFNVEKYPNICFQSQKIEAFENHYKVTGQLTLHGVTKSVEIPFSYADKTFEGSFMIKRKDFSVGGNGTFMVADEITLNIICKIN